MRSSFPVGLTILLVVAGALANASRARADQPAPVGYSGQLLESGQPVTGNRLFTFQLYDSPTGGSLLYTQAESLFVSGGVYHTLLNAPASLWDGSGRWVGVSVDGGAELAPRVPVGWVPYAAYTPRPSSQVFTTFTTGARTINGDAWVATDSLTFTLTAPGAVIVNMTGAAQFTGSLTAPSFTLALSRSFPADWDTYCLARYDVHSVSMTRMESLAPGTYTYYVWGRVVAPGQTYNLMTKLLQATFIP